MQPWTLLILMRPVTGRDILTIAALWGNSIPLDNRIKKLTKSDKSRHFTDFSYSSFYSMDIWNLVNWIFFTIYVIIITIDNPLKERNFTLSWQMNIKY